MSNETVEPTIEKTDSVIGKGTREAHPAFGLIGASRSQGSGAVLFDSDIKHRHTVTVTIYEAERERNLNHDRVYPKSTKGILAEVQMSEAQWASFVSSMNTGFGVPCTVRRTYDDYNVAGLPYAPRMEESMSEVRDAGEKAIEKIREAFDVAFDKPTKANMRYLKAMIDNAPSNMTFAAKSLSEYTENVVQRARADIEAMVTAKAQQLGLDPAELGVPQLETGDEDTWREE